jgi:hypothetical protein
VSQARQTHYNLVRPHLALGTTPGVTVGLPDLWTFRWRTLIDLVVTANGVGVSV